MACRLCAKHQQSGQGADTSVTNNAVDGIEERLKELPDVNQVMLAGLEVRKHAGITIFLSFQSQHKLAQQNYEAGRCIQAVLSCLH